MTKAREIAELGQKLTVDGSGNLDFGGDMKLQEASPAITFVDTSVANLQHKINSSSDNLRFTIDENDVDAGNRAEFVVQNNTVRLTKTENVFNETSSDIDFRVESVGNANALFVDASAGGIGMGITSSPEAASSSEGLFYTIGGSFVVASNTETVKINRNGTGGNNRVNLGLYNNGTKRGEIGTYGASDGMFFYLGTSVDAMRLTSGEAVFNEAGADINFRVESDTEQHMIFVDAGNNKVGIGQDAPTAKLHINSQDVGSVTNLIVSQLGNTSSTSFVAQEFKFNEGGVPGAKLMAGKNAFAGTDFYIYTGQAANGSYVQRMKFYGAATTSEGGVVFNEDSYNQDFRVESDSNSSALFIDASTSNVGINTGSPSTGMLTINGAANYSLTSSGQARSSGIHVDGGAAGGNNTYGGAISFGTGSGSAAISSVQNSSDGDTQGLAFHTHPSGTGSEDAQEKMRLTAFGRLGINEQSPEGHLHITGTNESDGATLYLQEANNNTSDNLGRIYFGNNADSTLANILAYTSGANNTSFLRISTTSTGTQVRNLDLSAANFIVNEEGANMDFRVESDSVSTMLFVDAAENEVGIGTNDPNAMLGVYQYSGKMAMRLASETNEEEVIFRMQGKDGSSVTRYADIKFDALGGNERLRFQAPYNTSSPQLELSSTYGAVFNEGGLDRDFRVETDTNANALFVDAGNNSVKVGGTSDSGSGAYRAELAVNGTYGQVYGNVSTWIVTVAMGGGQTVTLGTYTGDTGASISAHLVGHHHYSTGSSGTSAPLGVYQIMSAMRKAGTSYTVINNQVVDSFTQGGASVPSLEFDNSNGQLKVVTAVNQGCYAEIRVVFQTNYQGAWTPSY